MVLALGVGSLAHAADTVAVTPDNLIATRQAGFDLVQGEISAMKATVTAGESVKPMVDAAKGLVSWGKVIPSVFPAGTDSGHNTKAKPDVWSDNAGFQKAAANFVAAAEKLQALADADDKAGFATQFAATGQACGACHRTFRAR